MRILHAARGRRIACLLAFLILTLSLTPAASALTQGEVSAEHTNREALEEYADKRIGILTGTIHDTAVKGELPEAELMFFSTVSDEVTALLTGQIDAFSMDSLTIQALMAENPRIGCVDYSLGDIPTSFAFRKNEKGKDLSEKMTAMLTEMEQDGSLRKLQDKWIGPAAGDYEVDVTGLDQYPETLVLGSSFSGKPNAYIYNGKPTGYEIELAVEFCRRYGYNLRFESMDFSGLIPAIASGMIDIAMDGILINEERKENAYFAIPDYTAYIQLAVLNKEEPSSRHYYTSVEELNSPDVKVGMQIGTVYDKVYGTYIPEAGIEYFNSFSDLFQAVKSGAIAGFAVDGVMAGFYEQQIPGITHLEEVLGPIMDAAFAMRKDEESTIIYEQLNEFLREIKADGSMEECLKKWKTFENTDEYVTWPETGENGTLRIGVNAEVPPMIYIEEMEIKGYEAELLARFCRKYGYKAEVTNVSFDGLLTGLQAGQFDIASSYLNITEERKETVRFSEPHSSDGVILMVAAPVVEKDFWESVAESFEKTFIREERWKMILQGIRTTCIISIGALVLGTLLGFGLCLIRRMKNPVIHAATTVYIRIMQGTPILVILMILFYIVFAQSGVRGEIIAIIAFALNFAAYSCEIFRSGIDSIDDGQREAALAIGFSRSQAFLKIILPQAAHRFLPVFRGEFISMMKMTSIVGYIAVQDLTRMTDLIRARTYEAFFPLIASAIIYFTLSALLTWLLQRIEIRVEPDRSDRRIKGVKDL